MLAATEGIVLHFIKYGESSVITTIYTREFGRQSYLLNAARSRKSKGKAGLLQPLFLVDLVAYQRQSRDLHRIKEIKSNQVYQNIPFDIVKSTQAIFLAEILYKTIPEQESYPELFDFMQNALLYFDLMDKGAVNFHLFFLFRLTKYLGFMPDMTKTGTAGWFDLKKGAVVPFQPSHPLYADKETTDFLLLLTSLKIQELENFKIPGKVRDRIQTVLLDYYQLHFENLVEIKSLSVLREVFR